MKIITSAENPLLKNIRKAVAKAGLTEDGLAVAEGPLLVEEALRSGCRVARVLVREDVEGWPYADRVSGTAFASIRATEHSQGVLALVEPPALAIPSRGLIVALDALQDPGNAGTIVRSAEAFGAAGVMFLKGSVNPWNPKCLRASAGSLWRVPLATGGYEDLPWFAAAGDASIDVGAVDLSGSCVVAIGNEGAGVSAELRSRCKGVRVPVEGVESLNAAIAASVILYEAASQRRRVVSQKG